VPGNFDHVNNGQKKSPNASTNKLEHSSMSHQATLKISGKKDRKCSIGWQPMGGCHLATSGRKGGNVTV